MLAKIRVEWREFHFCKKFLIQTAISFIVAYAALDDFLRDAPGGSVGEYLVRLFTDRDYFVLVFPILWVALTSKKGGEACRYPILIRYRTQNEYFLVHILAKVSFVLAALLEVVGIAFLLGLGHSLPVAPQGVYVTCWHPAELVPRQFLNVFCIACVALLVYEIMLSVIGNGILGVMLTSAFLLIQIFLDTSMERAQTWRWTLWGHATYFIDGGERLDYRFFALYWLILLLPLLLFAFELNSRKDSVMKSLRMLARRIGAPVLFCLLFCLLVLYTEKSTLAEMGEGLLVSMWNSTFQFFDANCLYWISLRLAAWLVVYAHLLRLEGGFSIYLFLRQKSYGRVFLRTYLGCIGRAACYFCVGTVVMALFFDLTMPGLRFGSLLWQDGLLLALAEEILEALSVCLLAFLVRCISKKAEIGFLVALVARLVLNFVSSGERPSLLVQLPVNLVLSCAVFFLTFRNFAEKYVDM